MSEPKDPQQETSPEFLSGGGEMGERIRAFDWTRTSLGPVDGWPRSLLTCIRIMLTSRQPIWIGWGKDLIKLYNDPYIAIVGGKHPGALGEPASVVWKDIWKDIGPMLSQVMDKDQGTYVESQLLIMERNGYQEETYYTFSYTPIPGDDGQTGGMICANTDDTERIISERHLKTLTELGVGLSESKTEEQVFQCVLDVLARNTHDFPFGVLYAFAGARRLTRIKYVDKDLMAAWPEEIDLAGDDELSVTLAKAALGQETVVFDRLQERIGPMPAGAWQFSSDKALLLPIAQTGMTECFGFLVVGLNPYQLLDEKYHQFFRLVGDQIATSLITTGRLEQERLRIEELAALDRAKTVFFSNISHEFRTPLTLILGPVRDTLEDAEVTERTRSRMEVAYRNSLRLSKLVNNLLDFSRIEAGRMQAAFEPADLAVLTKDLASSFRSAIEKTGITLVVRCDAAEPVFADLEMWEKVVVNLLSNAFKYTPEGTITVSLSQQDGFTTLAVADTGVGIPPEEQERIFERFHRVQNMRSRSQEGTGIGLSLVSELVKLHGGTIEVSSKVGVGSVFTVRIPLGTAHLPPDMISDRTLGTYPLSKVDAYLGEAMKWAQTMDKTIAPFASAEPGTAKDRPRVLLADDNTDMRGYIRRLLEPRYEIIEASNGEEAYRLTIEKNPDLIVTDVMMPVLDGFGLIGRLRWNKSTQMIPVLFLSARAGEEARIEGIQAGANDYLVKPFSARELLAKIDGNLRIALSRKKIEESELLFRTLAETLPQLVWMTDEKGNQLFASGRWEAYTGLVPVDEETWKKIIHPGDVKLIQTIWRTSLSTGSQYKAEVRLVDTQGNYRWHQVQGEPVYNEQGAIIKWIGAFTDIHDQKTFSDRLEKTVFNRTAELQRSNDELEQFAHVASHDLREPLRKIRTFNARLRQEYKDQLPEKAGQFLDKIDKAAVRMNNMIEGVLSYSSLQDKPQKTETVSLGEIIRDIRADLELPIEQKGATILAGDLPEVSGDPLRLYQLFYNLISNSLKFSRPGVPPVIKLSGSVVARQDTQIPVTDVVTGNPSAAVSGSPLPGADDSPDNGDGKPIVGNSRVSIRVEDNGIGFPVSYADKIFKAFVRLHSRDRFEGTGLGLALCKRIAENHGGSIRAESREGEGAVFIIDLPVHIS
ncbi:MAG: ATP-binding protein [Puia sp.]|nr:ATP-binding protein [Puia sp.]